MEHFLNKVKNALQKGLPGMDAQYKMAPVNRQKTDLESRNTLNYRQSAVIILFCCDENNHIYIPLIVRKTYKGAHSGQVSFPGGKFEEQDESLENTALRECFEEIGINAIEILGPLTELYIPVSGFKVQPYVAFCNTPNPLLTPQEREVESLLKLKVTDLLKDEIVKEGSVKLSSHTKMTVPYFEVENHQVWGATAMMLNELKHLLK
ncbi:MAG: CoA pyrophosphatase [Bacteroidia bacterium]|nr:CoA pyrophosphatase [Bacteroidia bacterium]